MPSFMQLILNFNSQPHEEADIEEGGYAVTGKIISTRSLTRRLTEMLVGAQVIMMYFNSQPHEEADWLCRN